MKLKQCFLVACCTLVVTYVAAQDRFIVVASFSDACFIPNYFRFTPNDA